MEPSEKRELLEAHRFSSELDDKTATATAAVLDLRPTQPGEKPRVVVLRTGWAVCRFLKDVDTSAYDDMQVPPPPPSPAANWKRDVQDTASMKSAIYSATGSNFDDFVKIGDEDFRYYGIGISIKADEKIREGI
uniref:Uncharacterized protein n=1 Tax=Oryza sativa subsp. japonica TaxID=39947 RepID=Q65XB4_ORYSJ|nr:hypothetical protein [Oryza sativa Japonica Group]